MRLVRSSVFLKMVPPPKRLLGVVCNSDGRISLSISDPYLSFAQPLWPISRDRAADIQQIAQKHDARGIVFGFAPLQNAESTETTSREATIVALSAMATNCVGCCFDQRITPDEAWANFESNLLWEDTGLVDVDSDACVFPANVSSAIMLQCFLDETCGGWANTFG